MNILNMTISELIKELIEPDIYALLDPQVDIIEKPIEITDSIMKYVNQRRITKDNITAYCYAATLPIYGEILPLRDDVIVTMYQLTSDTYAVFFHYVESYDFAAGMVVRFHQIYCDYLQSNPSKPIHGAVLTRVFNTDVTDIFREAFKSPHA